jgi:hypothetical protein
LTVEASLVRQVGESAFMQLQEHRELHLSRQSGWVHICTVVRQAEVWADGPVDDPEGAHKVIVRNGCTGGWGRNRSAPLMAQRLRRHLVPHRRLWGQELMSDGLGGSDGGSRREVASQPVA